MSTVVDVAGGDESDGSTDGDATRSNDPFAGGHIEIDDRDARLASPSAWLGGVTRRIDDLATRLTYGRREEEAEDGR